VIINFAKDYRTRKKK